jgi:hypothetical protein
MNTHPYLPAFYYLLPQNHTAIAQSMTKSPSYEHWQIYITSAPYNWSGSNGNTSSCSHMWPTFLIHGTYICMYIWNTCVCVCVCVCVCARARARACVRVHATRSQKHRKVDEQILPIYIYVLWIQLHWLWHRILQHWSLHKIYSSWDMRLWSLPPHPFSSKFTSSSHDEIL